MEDAIYQRIAEELGVRTGQVRAAARLLDEGATVPFVARYRKEATGGLDDTQLRALEGRLAYLRELEARRETILDSIRAQGKLTPELEAAIRAADSKTRLEDLYRPYQPKRRSKAQKAREAGLGPLAEAIAADPGADPETLATAFVDAERGVADVQAALEGARQMPANWRTASTTRPPSSRTTSTTTSPSPACPPTAPWPSCADGAWGCSP